MSSGLAGTGRRIPVPIHVPPNQKMLAPNRLYRGSRSNNIDSLGQGVPSRVARVAWHLTHPYNTYAKMEAMYQVVPTRMEVV
jgi:hypothetical protein